MAFEWDKMKDEMNVRKHGIRFADTFAVFEDPNALTVDDNIRIISARRANRHEVGQYESEL